MRLGYHRRRAAWFGAVMKESKRFAAQEHLPRAELVRRRQAQLERLLAHARERSAFYATTEGLFGCECERHDGIHLFDDASVVENVDEDNRPVPPGEPGARVLVTNLHNLVQPIIRLAVADVMTLDLEPCGCGRSLIRAAAVEGRCDDVLALPARGGGTVSVLPAQFSAITRDRAVREFQVRQEPGGVRILVVPCGDGDPELEARLRSAVSRALGAVGVDARVEVERRRELARRGRKAQLVVAAEDPLLVQPSEG
jgi:phenylacetate-CoA ligase